VAVSICTRSVFASLAAAFSWLLCVHAHAGPPFKTDDPTPVAFGHYELYTAAIGTHVKGDTSGALPGVELTYGLIPNGQLQIGGEAAFDSPADGATHFGYGDTELSFKYRFIQEEKDGFGPQVAIFPAVHFPTGNRDRGLGAGHVRVFLPVWVQKSFGDWTTYGGGGYWINRDDDLGDKNYWFFGWLLERKITEKLTLGGEIFHQTAATVDGKDSSGFDLGGTYDFDEHNHLLFSAGRGFENASDTNLFSWYLGWELTY
jgi:outer membrane putative beta-barrel porin/alpha-amylase